MKDTTLDGMVFKLLQQVLIKSTINPSLVEDIVLGNVCSLRIIVPTSLMCRRSARAKLPITPVQLPWLLDSRSQRQLRVQDAFAPPV